MSFVDKVDGQSSNRRQESTHVRVDIFYLKELSVFKALRERQMLELSMYVWAKKAKRKHYFKRFTVALKQYMKCRKI